MKRPPRLLAAVLSAGLAAAAVSSVAARVQESPVVVRIPVTGTVELGLAPFVERALAEAAGIGADLAVLDIDTPGGRIDAAW
ncbi:MAG: nodulation protein NfeD, partial [Gemmatimonadetes bacterium]|nr:nodulation protein NfeD [Gemmatimonadota bacterium]